jgi:hypothetical protein
MARRFYRYIADNGLEILFVVIVAAIAGAAGGGVPTVWFYHGVCW